jgi:hypothetical protein
MTDLLLLSIVVAAFAGLTGLVRLCAHIVGTGPNHATASTVADLRENR